MPWYRVSTAEFGVDVQTNGHGIIEVLPPFAKWARGKHIRIFCQWFARQFGKPKVEKLSDVNAIQISKTEELSEASPPRYLSKVEKKVRNKDKKKKAKMNNVQSSLFELQNTPAEGQDALLQ